VLYIIDTVIKLMFFASIKAYYKYNCKNILIKKTVTDNSNIFSMHILVFNISI